MPGRSLTSAARIPRSPDYSDSDKGQIKTRIETFVEMLRASKASKRSREQKVP